MAPRLTKIGLASLVVAALIFAPGTAGADPGDDAFVQAVQGNGLAAFFASPAAEIGAAQRMCTNLRNHAVPESLAFILARDHNMSMGQAQSFMNVSVRSYCPDATFPPF